MPDANFFRAQAQRCRELLWAAKSPEVIEQLRRWEKEFEAEATAMEGEEKQSTHVQLTP